MITAMDKSGQWVKALQVFEAMRSAKLQPNIISMSFSAAVCIVCDFCFQRSQPRLMGFANDHVDKQTRYVLTSEANLKDVALTNESMHFLLNVG